METHNSSEPVLPTDELSLEAFRSSSSSSSSSSSHLQFLRTHLLTHVDRTWAWIPLIMGSFMSGLNDASAFVAWGSFTDMQTGNTIFLGLGASHQPVEPPLAWLKALVAISAYLLSCSILPRIQRAFSPSGTTRGGLFVSWFVQATCLLASAGLVQGGIAPQPYGTVTPADMDPQAPYLTELGPIALMAFQAGGQIACSRMLGFNEIPTLVLTSAYCDLASDAFVFRFRNAKRDRRVMSIIALLIGAIASGWLSRSNGRLVSVLWIGAFLKMSISISFLFWPGEEQKNDKK